MTTATVIIAIVSGVLSGILANLLTPPVSRALGRYSSAARIRNDEARRVFDNSIRYLIEHPIEEINLRIQTVGQLVAALFSWTGSLAFLIISFSIPSSYRLGIEAIFTAASILIGTSGVLLFVSGFVFFRKAIKLMRLLNETWRQRSAGLHDIDIN